MSLKAFHLFFVAVSIIFTLLFGAWSVVEFLNSREALTLVLGFASLLISLALVVYGGYVVRKLKGVSLI
jgi:hypothetical protein